MILRTVRRAPLHGYALVQRIKRASNDLLEIEEGSLYPALQRLPVGGTVIQPVLPHPATLKGEKPVGLTPRELEILQLIVDGKSNGGIAQVLELSANTVVVHRANIVASLGLRKTAELVAYAIRNGLVSMPRSADCFGSCLLGNTLPH